MQTVLEVTDLKQWRYCPRIVWYRYCLPAVRPTTLLMRQGQSHHSEEEGREERRSLRTYGLEAGERHFDLRLRSERLGLRGRLDLAIRVPGRGDAGDEAVVVEYKDSERAAGAHFKLQLAAYGLLLEEAWGLSAPAGWIYHIPLRKAERLPLSTRLRQQVREATTRVQRSIQGEVMPEAPVSRRPCVGCEFRRFCNDVV